MTEDPLRAVERLAAVARSGLLDTAPEESFDRLAALARELLGAPYAFITVVDEHRSFWKSRLGVDLSPAGPVQNTVEESFCQYVVASGEALVSGDVRLDPLTAANPSIESMGVVAWAGYPVLSPDGHVLGSFCVVDTVPRSWTDTERRVLQTLSQVAGTEIALRQTAAEASTALEAARQAQRRVQLLAASGELLRAGLDLDAVLAAVTHIVVPVLGAAAVVYTVDERGTITTRTASVHHEDPQWEQQLRDVVAHDPVTMADAVGPGFVLRTGRAQLAHLDEATLAQMGPVRAAAATRFGLSSTLSAPLRARGRVFGALHILRQGGDETYSADDLALATEAADRAALALDNAVLYAEQRDAAVALQQALLVPGPRPEDLQVAVRYLPAAAHAEVGGDWHDSFQQADGSTVLIIGDVVGHDLRAAAGMGQLRSMLRLLGYHRADTPAEVLTRVDGALAGLEVETMATSVLARVGRGEGCSAGGPRHLRWSNAGHPPPVLLQPDGTTTVLETEPEALLGLDPGVQRHDHEAVLAPGATLLLYTDGLVERRDRPLGEGIAVLAETVGGLAGAPLEDFCDEVLARSLPEVREDDVAVLAVRNTPPAGVSPPRPGAGRPGG